jgi:predicted RNase H-like HicB family nuclease
MAGDSKVERLSIPLSVVTYREGEWSIAHCLQMDLVAEGKTPQEALDNVFDLIDFHVSTALEVGDIESVFRPAPAEIWKMFWLGRPRKVRRRPPSPIERFEARELALA